VQGLKSAKEIWDVLKTEHEGDEVTKITKRETIEGELSRFVLNQGQEPQAMYNRLKTLVNQVRNLGSTKWDDYEMVKVILRSLVFRNPTQVQSIHGDPRYKLMSPEEVIGKFVSFELMIKGSKQIVNLEQGGTSESRLEGVDRRKLKFTALNTLQAGVSVRIKSKSRREGKNKSTKKVKRMTRRFVLPRFGSKEPSPR
jgi:hypothetical protein